MKTDLVSRLDIWELAGSMAMTVRPGSELEGVIRRYANAIDNAPTIDAIPVEWIKALTNHSDMFTRGAAKWVLGCWKKEQEVQK